PRELAAEEIGRLEAKAGEAREAVVVPAVERREGVDVVERAGPLAEGHHPRQRLQRPAHVDDLAGLRSGEEAGGDVVAAGGADPLVEDAVEGLRTAPVLPRAVGHAREADAEDGVGRGGGGDENAVRLAREKGVAAG